MVTYKTFQEKMAKCGESVNQSVQVIYENSMVYVLFDSYVICRVSMRDVGGIETNCPYFIMLPWEVKQRILHWCVRLSLTPTNQRVEPTRYIVPLPRLVTSDGEQQYLTQKGKDWFACRRNLNLRQTWKKEHLKYIPEEYRQYAVEVANEQKAKKE